MADQNQPAQPPRVGVVGQPSQAPVQPGQSQQAAAQPQRGVPGAQPPPVPTQEQIQKVMAQQQARQQADMAVAQRRATKLAETAQPGQSVQVMTLGQPDQPQAQPGQSQAGVPVSQQTIPSNVAQQMPPGMQPPPPPSPVPGMTAQQVFAGVPQPGQPQAQSGNQFSQMAQQQPVEKIQVPWYPIRSKGVNVELEDAIIVGVPEEGIGVEGNPQAKVVLALFSEVLYLRQLVQQMAQQPGADPQLSQRVYQLERVLYEQRQGMQSRARGVREQIAMFQGQGLSPDQIVAALSMQSQQAEDMVENGAIEEPVSSPQGNQDADDPQQGG